jgi:hypothetical protein
VACEYLSANHVFSQLIYVLAERYSRKGTSEQNAQERKHNDLCSLAWLRFCHHATKDGDPLSTAAQKDGDAMFESTCCVKPLAGSQPTFGASVLAFADKPGVCDALGFSEATPSIDIVTGASLLSNMKETFTNGPLGTFGPRSARRTAKNCRIHGINHGWRRTKHGFRN